MNDGTTQEIQLRTENKNDDTLLSTSAVSTKAQEWRLEENMCWLTNEENQKASPSLRNCHSTTDSACCNWMHDDNIGSSFKSFIPDPCQGNYGELNLFMCISCRGGSEKYVIRAEATKEYIDEVTYLKREQRESTDIQNSVEDDIKNNRAYNGYVKLCATWVRRFWLPEYDPENTNFQVLNQPSKIFDTCGAIDTKISDDGVSVPYGS